MEKDDKLNFWRITFNRKSWLFLKDNLNINNEDKVNDITKVDIITERTKIERNQYCQ